MSTKKNIPNNEWSDRLSAFSSGNRGRIAAVAAQGMTVVEEKHFRDIEYDPAGKGNDIIISVGGTDNLFTHTVSAPSEVNISEEDNGHVSSLEIVDQNGEVTTVRLR